MAPYLADLGAPGLAYPYLDAYWKDAGRYPYLIVHDSQVVGFALVHQATEASTFELAEFYIAAEFRKRGFGRQAAQVLFQLHVGEWSVAVRRDNSSGRAFWSSLMSEHLLGRVVGLETSQGIRYSFSSRDSDDTERLAKIVR